MIDEAQIAEALRERYPNINLIYLFGSYAAGNANQESDIDLALVGLTAAESARLPLAAMNMGAMFNQDVDLIDLPRSDAVIGYEVIAKGRCLYISPGFDKAEFEVRRIREFLELEERLSPIYEDMRRVG